MKKIISISLVILMLTLCFAVPSLAVYEEEEPLIATFSEDYQTMFVDGNRYSRVNTSNITYYDPIIYGDSYNENLYYEKITGNWVEAKLSNKQKETVEYISIYSYDSSNVIYEVEIYYKDGANLTLSFLHNDYLGEYNRLCDYDFDEFYVNFMWPDGNSVAISKETLSGEQTTREFGEWDYNETFSVEGAIKDGSLRYIYGEIRHIDNEFYFYDPMLNKHVEAYYNSENYLYDDESELTVKLSLITDPATKEALNAALQKYYQDDMGYIYNDELLEGVSKVFLVILFGIIPFGAFITFLVLFVKTKKKTYKKIFITGCIVSFAEIAAFITAAVYLFK